MFVCREQKILFLAIPKTGTRSIYDFLSRYFLGSKYKEHCYEIPLEFAEFFTFCVVRNPYDRAVSQWWSTCMRAGDQYQYLDKIRKMGLTNSLSSFLKVIEVHGWGMERGPLRVALPQNVYARNNPNRILRFETLESDFRTLPFVEEGMTLGMLNTTKERRIHNWESIIDSESIALVNKLYGEDFEAGGYEKLTP